MAKKDYYQVLGLPRGASESEIKRAYKRLALKYHPDKNPGEAEAAEKMKEINEAYAVLVDPVKRHKYDLYGHAGLEGYTAEDIFGGIDFGSIFRELGLRDIFSSFGFGGSFFESFFGTTRAGGRELRRGADLQYDLEVDLEEVFLGVEKRVNLPKTEVCPYCQGTRAEKGGLSRCRECGGRGQIVREERNGFTMFREITTCAKCRGEGKIVTLPCKKCKGLGILEVEKEITLPIPKGADSGHILKIEGEGEAGEDGGVAGDLYVRLRVKSHPVFKRRGDDIYVEKEITLTKALLGGIIYDVPAIDGKLTLEIPEGIEDGTCLKIEGKGMPRLGGEERGDEYVVVRVAMPKKLSAEEKVLLKQFERLRLLNLDPLFISQFSFDLPSLPPPDKEKRK